MRPEEPEPPRAARRWVRPVIAAALFVGSVLLYARSLPYPFTSHDDPDYVSDNVHVTSGLTADSVRWALTSGEQANWHPLTWLSLQFDATFWGAESAAGFRATNVLLHAANSALLFHLLATTTGAVGRSAVVAALWAAHPLHVESVVWVTERKDVLSQFFGLLALVAYVGYVRRPGAGRYLLTGGLFALGLTAKPMLVTLPFALLLLDYWPLGRTGWKKLVAEKLPLIAVAVASAVVTVVVQRRGGAVGSLGAIGIGERAANAAVGYVLYLGQTIWPADLAVFYPRVPRSLLGPGPLAAVAALIAVTAACLRFGRRYPYLPVGWFWYLGTLVPVIGLVQIGSQDRADRYTYLPHVGLFVAGVWGAADLLRRWPAVRAGVAAVAVLGAAGVCWVQVGYWRSNEVLWDHTIDVTGPNNWLARLSRGFARGKAGRGAEALDDFRAAAALDPGNPHVRVYLGGALSEQGYDAEAIPELEEAVRLSRGDREPLRQLARGLVRAGRAAEAVPHFAAAAPGDDFAPVAGLIARGREWLARGDVAAARIEFAKVAAAADWLAEPRYLLGVCDDLDDKPDSAVKQFREALRLAPTYAPAHARLALVLNRTGGRPVALAAAEAAVRFAPTDPAARSALGLVLLDAGREADAKTEFAEAVRLAPGWPAAVAQEAWAILSGPGYPTGMSAARDFARQGCEASEFKEPTAVAALAAAEAAAGRYREAAELADRAAAAADQGGRAATAEEYRRHAERYRAGKPFREGP